MTEKVKVSFNVKPDLADYLKKEAAEKKMSVTELLTRLISAGKFVEETQDGKEKIFVGRDVEHLRQVEFR